MKAFVGFLLALLAVIGFSCGSIALDLFKQRDLVLPRTTFGNISLSGMTRNEAREAIRQQLKDFSEKPFQIAARGVAKTITFKDLGIVINESVVLSEVPFARDISNIEIALLTFVGRRIMPDFVIERTEILRVIEEKFPDIPRAQNAHFILEKKVLKIEEAREGVTPNIEPIVLQLQSNIAFLEQSPLLVEFLDAKPTVWAADLENNKAQIVKRISRAVILLNQKDKWEVNFAKNPQWVLFEAQPYAVSQGEFPLKIKWEPVTFSNFLNEKVSKYLEQAPENIRIWREADGKMKFEGNANEGRAIERERLLALINNSFDRKDYDKPEEIEIPLVVVQPKVDVSEDLQALGIKELVAVGHTRFAGSPANRMHNIGVGISKFDGLLIPPGETFSFNKNLGRVDETTGFRKELVIKPEGTIPEFGGGLCQVSTTLYRAAIYGGMPIVEREPHSYVVSYYSQIGGHGLDATIYPPTRDLKFTNDTSGSLLIHSYVQGVDAYFKLFGTSDGRKVTLEGPYISNRTSAPPEPKIVIDPKMQPGEKKQVEKPHAGFDSLWYRFITKNGVTAKESIFSHYKAIPAKFLVGEQVNPEGENQGLTPKN
ncbi:MAG: VanW family protein [Patescibacteria group bacterium]